MKLSLGTLILLTAMFSGSVMAQVICQNSDDPDGDGWGWENNDSCRMPSGGTSNTNSNNNTELTLSTLLGQCIADLAEVQNNTGSNSGSGDSNCVDTAPVGDGWGWNGSTSCRVTADSSQAQQCTSTTGGTNNGSQGGQYGTGFTDYTNAHPTCEEAGDRILRLVSEGMHESEVLRLVGKPRDVRTSGSYIYWDYSTNYYDYPRITFRSNGRTVTGFRVNTEYCRR